MLSGDTVIYVNAPDISATLDYDFGVERSFSYKGLDKFGIVQLAGLSDRIEHKGSSKTGGYYLREA